MMLRFIFTIFCLISLKVHSESTYAWWLTEELELNSLKVDSIPIEKIDSDFSKVGLPSISAIPKNEILGVDEIKKGSFKFRLKGMLSNSPSEHVAVVGAYLDKNKNKGRFLLVYESSSNEIRFFEKLEGKASFSFLYLSNGILTWTSCLYCGDVNPIIWKSEKFIRDDSQSSDY